MKGHVAKKGAKFYPVADLGVVPAQRCIECNRRAWLDGRRLDTCAKCGGGMRDTEERRQLWLPGCTKERDAHRALRERLTERDKGSLVVPSARTLDAYVRDEWLPEARTRLRATTIQSYSYVLDKLVLPRLGHRRLDSLKPVDIGELYQTLLASGGRYGRELSGRSVQLTARVLGRVLADAVVRNYIAKNPAANVRAPSPNTREVRPWDAQTGREFLAHVGGHRLRALWAFLLVTGCRRGEALGLGWTDLALDERRASFRRSLVNVGYEVAWSEPKTKAGRRTITLDPALVDVMRAHRLRQLQERLAAGEAWQEHGLVFCQEDGTPYNPQNVSRAFERLVVQAKLPKLSLHGLRHSAATTMIERGASPRDAQEQLGHANVGITLAMYVHPGDEQRERTAATLANAFLGSR